MAERYPTVTIDGRRQHVHIVIAEAALGRPLPAGVEVHHVDENKNNNAPSNLVICEDHSYHRLLHRRQRIIAAGGNPNTDQVCAYCHSAKLISDFDRNKNETFGHTFICKECVPLWKQRHAPTEMKFIEDWEKEYSSMSRLGNPMKKRWWKRQGKRFVLVMKKRWWMRRFKCHECGMYRDVPRNIAKSAQVCVGRRRHGRDSRADELRLKQLRDTEAV